MIPLLIVDDEAPIRQSIASMLSGHYPDTFAISQAENGRQALEHVAAAPVSMILADIKMPLITGLEMLERLRELDYRGEVIVISGFDDYALVRQALKNGATDYLLKPISADDFYLQIDAFLRRVAHGVSPANAAIPASPLRHAYWQQHALEKLLEGEMDDSLLRELDLSDTNMSILCLVDLSSHSASQALFQRTLTNEWAKALAPLLAQGCRLLQGEWQKQLVFVFLYSTKQQASAFRALPLFETRPGVNIVRAQPRPLAESPQSLHECQALLSAAYYDLPPIKGPDIYPYPALITRIVNALCALDAKDFTAALRQLLGRASAERPAVESLRQLLASALYAVVRQNSLYIRLIASHELTENDAMRCIQASRLSILSSDLQRIGCLLIEEAQAQSVARNGQHYQRALQYIASHFAQDISLGQVAEHLGIHPNYFSSLFKKKCGVSYSQYLRRIRIEEACRLMASTGYKLYEIAEMVGYHEPVQFNRAFREEMGCSPTTYKQRHV